MVPGNLGRPGSLGAPERLPHSTGPCIVRAKKKGVAMCTPWASDSVELRSDRTDWGSPTSGAAVYLFRFLAYEYAQFVL